MIFKTEDIVRATESMEDFFKLRPDAREFLTDILDKAENNVCDIEYSIGAHIEQDGIVEGCIMSKLFKKAGVYLITETHKDKPSVALVIKENTENNVDSIVAYISFENVYCIEKISMPKFEGDTTYAWKYFYEEFESKMECLLKVA